MLNDVNVKSSVRYPRGIVKLNGTVIDGWVSFDVENNTHYSADTFRVVFVISQLPSDRGIDWFSSNAEIKCEVFAGVVVDPDNFTISDLDNLIVGRVDDVNIDLAAGTVELSGRDYTSVFIDAKTSEKYRNQKSSDIARTLAAKHKLGCVWVETKEKAGTYYDIDKINMQDQRSEWDLLTWLAHQEGYIVFVKGEDLHFIPPPKETDAPYVLQWSPPDENAFHPVFNGKTISMTRNLTVAKSVQVVVRSWNQKHKKPFSATYPKKAKTTQPGKASIAGDVQVYSYTVPNLTQEKAYQLAQSKHKEITKHERKINITLPADNVLSTTNIIKLVGTGTTFDQLYYPESITRRMDVNDGYSMTVNAKNSSPESNPTL